MSEFYEPEAAVCQREAASLCRTCKHLSPVRQGGGYHMGNWEFWWRECTHRKVAAFASDGKPVAPFIPVFSGDEGYTIGVTSCKFYEEATDD